MSDNLEVQDLDLDEAKATGEDSMAADPTTPAGGAVKARKGDVKKKVDPTADNIEDTVKTPQGKNDTGLKEAIEGLFEGTDLTEDFKSKAVAVFEAAVHEKVVAEKQAIQEEFESQLDEQVEKAVDELVEKVDTYLDFVVEQWMSDNAVEIESNFKVEVAESLLDSIKGLVAEHNIELDEEQADHISEIEAKMEDTAEKYNATVEELIAVREEKESLERQIAFQKISEGLTDTQAEKLKVLSEGVSFESTEEYATKVDAIKENYFTESAETTAVADETEFLEESTEEQTQDAQTEIVDPSVDYYAKALGRFVK
jgi:hypothetical protein